MGRQPWSNRRVVEDCRVLSIATLVRFGLFDAWTDSGGYRHELSRTIELTSGFAVGVTLPGRYVSNHGSPPASTNDTLELVYGTSGWEVKEEIDIASIPSPLRQAERRYYFLCPGWDEVECGRRVGKLNLPRGETYFRCRACYDLTYRSVKEHDKRVDELIGELPLALIIAQALYSPNLPASLLALRALAHLVEKERRKASAA